MKLHGLAAARRNRLEFCEWQLAEPAYKWWDLNGFDGYGEIRYSWGPGQFRFADMIAVRDGYMIAVEMKIQWNIELINQLDRARTFADGVCGCVYKKPPKAFVEYCQSHRIGLLQFAQGSMAELVGVADLREHGYDPDFPFNQERRDAVAFELENKKPWGKSGVQKPWDLQRGSSEERIDNYLSLAENSGGDML